MILCSGVLQVVDLPAKFRLAAGRNSLRYTANTNDYTRTAAAEFDIQAFPPSWHLYNC